MLENRRHVDTTPDAYLSHSGARGRLEWKPNCRGPFEVRTWRGEEGFSAMAAARGDGGHAKGRLGGVAVTERVRLSYVSHRIRVPFSAVWYALTHPECSQPQVEKPATGSRPNGKQVVYVERAPTNLSGISRAKIGTQISFALSSDRRELTECTCVKSLYDGDFEGGFWRTVIVIVWGNVWGSQ